MKGLASFLASNMKESLENQPNDSLSKEESTLEKQMENFSQINYNDYEDDYAEDSDCDSTLETCHPDSSEMKHTMNALTAP